MSVKRNTYDDVKQIVENEGYELLSANDEIVNEDGYVWSTTKIKVRCDKGHKYEVVWNNFKNLKNRCKICHEENRKCTYNDLLEVAKNRGYKLLSKEKDIVEEDGTIKSTTRIKVKCPKGHEYDVILNSFKNNQPKCKQCYDEETRYTYEDLKNIVEDMGYELVSEEADIIERAIERAIDKGYRTEDIYINGGILVGTQMMGNIICEYIRELVNEDLDKIAI